MFDVQNGANFTRSFSSFIDLPFNFDYFTIVDFDESFRSTIFLIY